MGDNNNKKDELPYQIPGVIIPEQVTDSGKVVGTSDTKDTLNDIKNNSEESNQSIYETPRNNYSQSKCKWQSDTPKD